ncbi:MAG: DUF3040 domain-containing protein [Streptosporangiaceae bacterium]
MASDETGVPGLARDGAALTGREMRAMREISRQMTAADPGYAERLNTLGGYEHSPLGMPSRWAALPVAVIGVLLAVGVLFTTVFLDGQGPEVDTSGTVVQQHGR